jgi:hypothetical protein
MNIEEELVKYNGEILGTRGKPIEPRRYEEDLNPWNHLLIITVCYFMTKIFSNSGESSAVLAGLCGLLGYETFEKISN